MNELISKQQSTELVISQGMAELIQPSIAESTLKRYQWLSKQIEAWIGAQMLNDALLTKGITEL